MAQEQQEKAKLKDVSSGNVPEVKSTEKLLNSEMEAVEGGGVCVCKTGAVQKTTSIDDLE
jgi:hypothetical protein